MTTQDRWKEALKAVRADGVKVRQNVQKCCLSCIEPADLGFKGLEWGQETPTPYAYTYGGQGSRYLWVDGEPEYAPASRFWDRGTLEVVYFNWGGPEFWDGTDHYAARSLVARFSDNDFQVTWSGNEYSCVGVHV